MKKIPLAKPYLDSEIKDKVLEVLNSGHWTQGPVTDKLEKAFRAYIGCDYAIAVTSCTAGLEIALRAMDVGPGAEVIVPGYTHPATADAAALVGANIVVVDITRETMLIDYTALERAVTPKTKVIIPVSLFGNPLNYKTLTSLKEKHHIHILEDAACSVGAEFSGTRVGSLADISVFSLHPRKSITSGEGGVITTNNSKWAEWILSYKHFGMEANGRGRYSNFIRIGSNYKMSDILAAIGLVQVKRIDKILARRRELFNDYNRLLKDHPKIFLPLQTVDGKHACQTFGVFIENRNQTMKRLQEHGIETQIGTYCLQKQPAFYNNPYFKFSGDMKESRYAFEHNLALPLYYGMTDHEQEYVVDKLFEII